MPTRRINKTIFYRCNVCSRDYGTRLEARNCETQPAKKMALTKGSVKTDYWEEGDVVLLLSSSDEREWTLGIIKGKMTEHHIIYPIIESLENPAKKYESWTHRSLVLLENDMKRKIVAWADIILSNPDKVA